MLRQRCCIFRRVAQYKYTGKGVRALLTTCLMVPSLPAGDLSELQVTSHEGVYRVSMVMLVHAPASQVRGVLTDYRHIYRLDPAITESEILPSPDNNVVRVRTKMVGCVFVFCKEINRVEDVHETASGDLQAEMVPEFSNFRSGSAAWQIEDLGERSQIKYQASLEPDFFIPPVIGSYFVRKTLRNRIVASFSKLECIAQIRALLDHKPRQQLASLTMYDTGCHRHCGINGEKCLQ